MTYIITNTSIGHIENGYVYGDEVGSARIIASSEHFFAKFYVNVCSNADNNNYFYNKVNRRETTFTQKDLPEEGLALFADDSFVDTDEFW